MDRKLLARNILCALGTGVIINLGISTTAYASENQNNYSEERQNVIANDSVQQQRQQMERIKQISQEIADINARLSQLTEELNRYNEQLSSAQVDNNPQIDIDNVESFNENRQLTRRSQIPQEDVKQVADDFDAAKENQQAFYDDADKYMASAAETEKAEPIRITSEQIHRNDYNLVSNNTSRKVENDLKQASSSGQKDEYITDNKEAEISNERRNLSFDYNENGFKINYAAPNYQTNNNPVNKISANTDLNVQSDISRKADVNQLKNDAGNNFNGNNAVDLFSIDSQDMSSNSKVNENNAVTIDKRRNMALNSMEDNLKTDEELSLNTKKENSFTDTGENKINSRLQQDGKKYISSAYINRNRNISNPRSNDNIKIERNEAVMTNNDDRVLDLNKLTMLGRFNSPAPTWTYEYFDKLSAEGLLYPDDDFNLNSLTRREAAILTARSYNLYRIRSRHVAADSSAVDNNRFRFVSDDINVLMKEFAPEVRSLGYNIISEVTDTSVNYKTEWDWKYEGEIRYSASKNGGSPRYDWSDSRVYARIFGQKAISDDWSVNALLESEYNFLDNDNSLREDYDGDVELSRIYLQGKKNWWNTPFTIEAGKTYAYLGDGNVLDGDFKGVKISADVTPNANYTVGYGKVNDTENAYYLEALTQNRNYNYLAGIYHWDNYNDPVTITALGMNYYVDDWTLGGMYLNSDVADGSGAKDGYVLTARYKQHFAWVPHSYDFILKYYNMAGNTYINHTMNGVGSYMDGFSGWGAMMNYTLAEDLVLSLEYYDLKDKTTGEKGKTAWAQLSWFFD